MKKVLLACLITLVASAVFAADYARVWTAADSSPAIRIKNGYTGNITLAVTNATLGNVDVSDGTTASNIVVTALTTISQMAGYIAAYTNASGQKYLTVDYNCSLAADVCSNQLLQVTTTNAPGKWATGLKWDTSACLFYSAYLPAVEDGGTDGYKTLDSIHGDIKGTGNITLNVYADGVKVYQKVVVSPTYVRGSEGSTTNVTTADEVGPAQILEKLAIPLGASEGVFVRAVRATTATTGGVGIGAVVK